MSLVWLGYIASAPMVDLRFVCFAIEFSQCGDHKGSPNFHVICLDGDHDDEYNRGVY